MLFIDDDGVVDAERIIVKRFSTIERGQLDKVNGIVVHQTNSPTAQSTFNSYMEIKKIVFLVFLFIPTFTQARIVSEIKIMETGTWDSDNRAEYEKEGCNTFNPTKEQLIQYFSQAQESSSSDDWVNEYYSPCVASGKVTFKDGDSGVWRIHSSGLGWVDFFLKKRGYFYFTDNVWEK